MRGDGIARDNAALLERRDKAAFGANHLRSLRQRHVRFEPVNGSKSKPLGDRAQLAGIGAKVEPLAVADLVEAEMMVEAIAQSNLPCSSCSRVAWSSRSQKARSAFAFCFSASAGTSPL